MNKTEESRKGVVNGGRRKNLSENATEHSGLSLPAGSVLTDLLNHRLNIH